MTAPSASSTAPAASSSPSSGYSPVLRVATSLAGRHHILMPDGLTSCRRRLADTHPHDMRTFVEQFSDRYICQRCKDTLGVWGNSL